MKEYLNRLFSAADSKMLDFQAGLIPTVKRETMLGIATPTLKRLASEMIKSGEAQDFLTQLPHTYFEENQLHAFIICEGGDFAKALEATCAFLPYIDNWATCDQLIPKSFARHRGELLPKIEEWLNSSHTYTVRFAVGCLMRYFLDDDFSLEYPTRVSKIVSNEYYINMMCAWYFATGLTKRYDEFLPFLEGGSLPVWVHNKTISKARDSFKISNDKKAYLKALKR